MAKTIEQGQIVGGQGFSSLRLDTMAPAANHRSKFDKSLLRKTAFHCSSHHSLMPLGNFVPSSFTHLFTKFTEMTEHNLYPFSEDANVVEHYFQMHLSTV